jgi:hypothetical protein
LPDTHDTQAAEEVQVAQGLAHDAQVNVELLAYVPSGQVGKQKYPDKKSAGELCWHERQLVVVPAQVAQGDVQAVQIEFTGVNPSRQLLLHKVPSRLKPVIQLKQALALVHVLQGAIQDVHLLFVRFA